MFINKIQYTPYSQNPSFGLSFRKPQNIKLFDDMHIPKSVHGLNNDCFVSIEHAGRQLSISVDDANFREIGKSSITINDEKTLYNDNIEVFKQRQKHSGAGTLMKLGEIITMLENNIEEIKLYSLGQAVYFHSKFKFKPAITDIEELKDYIKLDVLPRNCDERFKTVCDAAKKWLDNEKQSENYIEDGNNILYEYLQTVNKYKLNLDEEYSIMPGFNMILTRDNVLKNKQYFNGLFNRFGIDYQINDSSY